MSSNQQIAKNTLYLYIRMAVTMLVSLFSVRIVLKAMGVEAYGVYTAIGGFVAALSFVSNVLTSSSQRYFSYELGKNSGEAVNKLFNTIFLIYIIFSVVIIIAAESIGFWFLFNKMTIPAPYLQSAKIVYHLSVLSFVTTMLCNPFLAIIIAKEKMSFYAIVSISESLLKLLAALVLLICNTNLLILYAALFFIITVSVNLSYVIYVSKLFNLKFSWGNVVIKRIKEILVFSAWTLFGTLTNVFNTQGLNILLNIFFGPLANAAYAISSQVSSSINGLSSNFYMAVRPPLIKSYAQGEIESVKTLFYFSSKVIFSLLFIVIFPIIIGTETILEIWLGEVSEYMVSFLRLILIYTLILNLSNPITTIIQAANRVKLYHGVVDSFTMLTLPISYILLKNDFDAICVFVVSIVIFSVAHFVRLIVLRRYFNFSLVIYVKTIILPIVVIVLLMSGIALCYKMMLLPESKIASIIQVFCMMFISIIVSSMLLFTASERQSLKKLIIKR